MMTDAKADSALSLKLAKGVGKAFEWSLEALEWGLGTVKDLISRLGFSEDFNNIAEAVNEGRLAARRLEFQRYGDLIGKTQLVDISGLANAKVEGVKVLAKCEFFNPSFSIKDRIVNNIFDKAESAGLLRSGDTVVAASSGNTGASVAMLAPLRGYTAVICTSPKCSKEKMDTIRAYGAKLLISAAGLAEREPGSYMNMAKDLARDNGWFDVNQYDNPDNIDGHYKTLGPEIWEQTGGRVTHFVAGGSTGGTISGTGQFLKEKNPEIEVTLADPKGSIFGKKIRGEVMTSERFLVEGVGKGSIPGCMKFDVIDNVIEVTDKEAFLRCDQLAKREGLLVGGSAGLNVEAALRIANKAKAPAVIVTVLCDLGVKYLSKVFNNDWLIENNIIENNLIENNLIENNLIENNLIENNLIENNLVVG